MTDARRLIVLAAGLLVAGTLAGLLVEGNGFDGSLVRSVAADRTAGLTDAERLVTQLGELWLDAAFAGVVLGLVVVGRRRDALFVLVAAGGAMILTNAIKVIVERPRPGGGGLVSVASASWPSGHATSSIAFYGALGLLAARWVSRGWGRGAIWVVVGVLVAAVGTSRVYLGVHYPSDVVAGWLVGGLWLAGVLRVLGADGPGVTGARGKGT
ncbi:MAG TPA: phosphatase PAP2 family protein [Solirubrobacteraceae bacterium]|nr:phosphatase PAP2 family protein [Solirubrobacteraceae bacterium]